MSKGETKTESTNSPNAENDSILSLLSPFLVYPVAANESPPYELIAWWKIIFSYLGVNKRAQLHLRWMCRIFRDAIPALPLWTSFPHPRYPTFKGLMGRLNHLGNHYVACTAEDMSIGLKVYIDRGTYEEHTITKINPDGTYITNELCCVPLARFLQKVINVLPLILFIDNGNHTIDIYKEYSSARSYCNYVNINIPISIIGESREHCIVIGGLKVHGKKEDDVNVSDLTLLESKGPGVWGNYGAILHLDNVSVENSGTDGVLVRGSKCNTMKNCNVSHSKWNGLLVEDGGSMTIDGNATTVHHNCTGGSSRTYGLHSNESSASFHLASSLTIETICKNNGGGGNYHESDADRV